MNDRLDFLRRRQQGLGGSDIAAIAGLSPWRTPLDVYLDKTEPLSEVDNPSEPMLWGSLLEDTIANEYARRNDVRIQRVTQQLQHPKDDWAIANIDRAIVAPGSRARCVEGRLEGADGILEVKTASAFAAKDWDDDAVPDHYVVQVQWYLYVCERDWADIAVLIGGNDYRQRRLERDDEVIRELRDIADEFWRRHVLGRIAPPARTAAEVTRLHRRETAGLIPATTDDVAVLTDLLDIREQIKALEARENTLVEWMKLRLGEHEGVGLDAKPLVTWKATKDSPRTDWKAACETMRGYVVNWDEIVQQHTTTHPGSRRFLITKHARDCLISHAERLALQAAPTTTEGA